jgi:hypothetical protein
MTVCAVQQVFTRHSTLARAHPGDAERIRQQSCRRELLRKAVVTGDELRAVPHRGS